MKQYFLRFLWLKIVTIVIDAGESIGLEEINQIIFDVEAAFLKWVESEGSQNKIINDFFKRVNVIILPCFAGNPVYSTICRDGLLGMNYSSYRFEFVSKRSVLSVSNLKNTSDVTLNDQNTIFEDLESFIQYTTPKVVAGQWDGDWVSNSTFFPQGTETVASVRVTNKFRDIYLYLGNNNNMSFSDTNVSEALHFSVLDVNRKVIKYLNQVVFPRTNTIGISILPQGRYWISWLAQKTNSSIKCIKPNFF